MTKMLKLNYRETAIGGLLHDFLLVLIKWVKKKNLVCFLIILNLLWKLLLLNLSLLIWRRIWLKIICSQRPLLYQNIWRVGLFVLWINVWLRKNFLLNLRFNLGMHTIYLCFLWYFFCYFLKKDNMCYNTYEGRWFIWVLIQ